MGQRMQFNLSLRKVDRIAAISLGPSVDILLNFQSITKTRLCKYTENFATKK